MYNTGVSGLNLGFGEKHVLGGSLDAFGVGPALIHKREVKRAQPVTK
jgi:hypothetical protein